MSMSIARRCRRFLRALVVILALVWTTAPASAQDASDSGWEFYATVYGWLPGLELSTHAQGPVPPTSVDMSISDVIQSLDLAVQGAFEARNDRLIGLIDVNYFSLSDDESLGGILFTKASVETSGVIASANLGYRLVEADPVVFDVFAGVQVASMKTELGLAGMMPVSRSDSQTLVDPLISARAFVDLGSGFFVGAAGSIGGFGVDSDLTWQVIGQVGWQANDWLTLRAGYRHQEFNLDGSHLIDNMTMSGPILGATFRL